MSLPLLGHKPSNSTSLPMLKTGREKLAQPTKGEGEYKILRGVDTTAIGPGPWFYEGIKASRPEMLVLMQLVKLGYHPKFQTDFMMGRSVKGGQVLDIILEETNPPTYIDVRSRWHYGAAKTFQDSLKMLMVESSMPGIRSLVIWEHDIENPAWLQNYLLQNLGPKGGRGGG